MKKNLLLLPFAAFLLIGCNTSVDVKTNTSKETVQLTTSNLSKYVAVNSSSTVAVSSTKNYWVFYTHFIGADNYRFVDCKISYHYVWSVNNETLDGSTGTASLTFSGDGEAAPFAYTLNGGYAVFEISSVSGTVEAM